jgi:hypothetical protein
VAGQVGSAASTPYVVPAANASVVAWSSVEHIRSLSSRVQQIGAGAPEQPIVATMFGEQVVTRAAVASVVAVPTEDEIISAAPTDDVIAQSTAQFLASTGPDQPVSSVRSQDERSPVDPRCSRTGFVVAGIVVWSNEDRVRGPLGRQVLPTAGQCPRPRPVGRHR